MEHCYYSAQGVFLCNKKYNNTQSLPRYVEEVPQIEKLPIHIQKCNGCSNNTILCANKSCSFINK